jgi:hypothetical protein
MNADQLPLNQTTVMSQDNVIRTTVTRISNDMIVIIYYHQPTNDVLLKVNARVDGAWSSLDYFDKVFWTILIEGRPATSGDLEDISRKLGSFKVDPTARTLDLGGQRSVGRHK